MNGRHIGLLLLLGAGGCKSMSAPPPMTEAPGYYGGEELDGSAMVADAAAPTTTAEPAPAADMDVEGGEFARRKGGRWRRDVARSEVAAPPVNPGPAGSASGGEVAEPAIEKPKPDDLDARHIVYTAQMTVSVFNLEDAMTKAEAIPEAYGGYIQSMAAGSIVLRIPSKGLRKVMDEIADYGVVDQRALQASDVTAEFVDIESRIKALEETHKQLLELLNKARTVQEALEVRQALDGITSELEVLKGRMRQLDNMTSYSTLSLSLYERGPNMPVPSSNDPFPWVNDLGVESTEWK